MFKSVVFLLSDWIMKGKFFFHECNSLAYENYKTSQIHLK